MQSIYKMKQSTARAAFGSALALVGLVPAAVALQLQLDAPGTTSLIVSDSSALSLRHFSNTGAYYHINDNSNFQSTIAGGTFSVASAQPILASNQNHIHTGALLYQTPSTVAAGTLQPGTYYVYYNAESDSKERVQVLNQLVGVGQVSSGIDGKQSQTREEKAANKSSASMVGAGINADYGRFTLNGVTGKNYSLPLSTSFKLNERMALNLGLPLIYTKIGDASAYGAGLSVGMPINVFRSKADTGFSWQLTPSLGSTGASCRELQTGGVMVNSGMTSLATYDFGKFAVSVGNHMSSFESTHAKFDGYSYETGMSQRAIKNGLKVDAPIGQRWVADVYTVHNKISGSDVLDHYMTYGVDVGYRIVGNEKKASSRLGYVSVGIKTDQGSGYNATNFQFGSGWKF